MQGRNQYAQLGFAGMGQQEKATLMAMQRDSAKARSTRVGGEAGRTERDGGGANEKGEAVGSVVTSCMGGCDDGEASAALGPPKQVSSGGGHATERIFHFRTRDSKVSVPIRSTEQFSRAYSDLVKSDLVKSHLEKSSVAGPGVGRSQEVSKGVGEAIRSEGGAVSTAAIVSCGYYHTCALVQRDSQVIKEASALGTRLGAADRGTHMYYI
jgi:hypothetical protein